MDISCPEEESPEELEGHVIQFHVRPNHVRKFLWVEAGALTVTIFTLFTILYYFSFLDIVGFRITFMGHFPLKFYRAVLPRQALV